MKRLVAYFYALCIAIRALVGWMEEMERWTIVVVILGHRRRRRHVLIRASAALKCCVYLGLVGRINSNRCPMCENC